MAKHSNDKKELVYYLTLFKIEGHSTWRASLKIDIHAFDAEWTKGINPPKITEKKLFKVNRITGEIFIQQ